MGRKQTIIQPTTITPHVPSDLVVSPSPNPDTKETKTDNSDEKQLIDILKGISNTMSSQAKDMSAITSRLLMGTYDGPTRNQNPTHLQTIPHNNGRTYQGPRADRGYNNSGNQGRDWSMVTCYKCGEMGHISRNCLTNVHNNPNPPRMGNNPPTARHNSSNVHSPPMGAPSTN